MVLVWLGRDDAEGMKMGKGKQFSAVITCFRQPAWIWELGRFRRVMTAE